MTKFLNLHALNKRARSVLKFIVERYAKTNKPVSSSMIAGAKGFSLSPATIRNVMAELEDFGLLEKSYRSAARIPTQLGYRYFVDYLMDSVKINRQTRQLILDNIFQYTGDLEGLLDNTSKLLANLSSHVGVILAPKFDETILQRIGFVKLSPRTILVILVSQSEIVKSSMIRLNDTYTDKELQKAAGYINSRFSDRSLRDIKDIVHDELRKETGVPNRLKKILFHLSESDFLDCPEGEFVHTGWGARFFETQGANNFEKIKSLYKALDEKRNLAHLLNECTKVEGIHIWIGSENPLIASPDLSFVASNYACKNRVMGSLGILGPIGMNYPKACTVVRNVAECFGEKLSSQPAT